MSDRKLFGTDGIRGTANRFPMTCEIAMALGRAVTHYFQTTSKRNKRPLIFLGKDTRLSCYMLEQAFASGVCSQGGRVVLTGPLPTPGIAFATQSMRANAGVMISASHNNFADNGIKIFDSNGLKLPDSVELELERMVLDRELIPIIGGADLGSVKRLDEVLGRYIVQVKSTFNASYDLEGIRIVIDCANGAGYKLAPMVFTELGAEVFSLAVTPDGTNINDHCGSLHPEFAQEHVHKFRADVGICLDGDADRIAIIDQEGMVIDGDHLIGIFAKMMLDEGHILPGEKVVGTVMSNLGLEHYVKSLGLEFHRTKVGDRYIIEHMNESGAKLGGEPSGHIIFRQYSTTGDGTLAGLKFLEAMKFYNKTAKELVGQFALFPQVIKNIHIMHKKAFEDVPAILKAVKVAEAKLKNKGRVLLRYSGTEPLVRVMVEGEDKNIVDQLAHDLCDVVKKELS